MKLNLAILLFALFTYSSCMNLSPGNLNTIRDILNTFSEIEEPETFMTSLEGLGSTFSRVNNEGSTQLATVIVQAYKAKELDCEELQKLIEEAVRVGNLNAYTCFSGSNLMSDKFDFLRVAAVNGHVHILDLEYARIYASESFIFKSRCGEIIFDAIKAGHFHILRWFADNGLLYPACAKKALLAALKTENEDMIKFLLYDPVFLNTISTNNRITYEFGVRNHRFPPQDQVLIKAAEIGNMTFVQYFLGKSLVTKPDILQKAQTAAFENNHSDIDELFKTMEMF